MSWTIFSADGKAIEKANTERSTSRAIWTFTAHELKNGRTAPYYTEPPLNLVPFEALDLADWALEVLRPLNDPGHVLARVADLPREELDRLKEKSAAENLDFHKLVASTALGIPYGGVGLGMRGITKNALFVYLYGRAL